MANIFAITTVAEDIRATADGKAKAIFTVSNNSNKPVRGIARVKALESTQPEWLEVEGETERDFGARGTQQYTIHFNRPVSAPKSGAAAGSGEKFPFRLDVASAANPDEDFTEGPIVRVEVRSAAQPPPPRKFPWWIILIIAGVVLVGGGVVLFLVLQKGGAKPSPLVGTWKMKTPVDPNSAQFIGILKIEQAENGELSALMWKINDAETGAPHAKLIGQATGETCDMKGPLDNRGMTLILKCSIMGPGKLSISYFITSPVILTKGETTQILERE